MLETARVQWKISSMFPMCTHRNNSTKTASDAQMKVSLYVYILSFVESFLYSFLCVYSEKPYACAFDMKWLKIAADFESDFTILHNDLSPRWFSISHSPIIYLNLFGFLVVPGVYVRKRMHDGVCDRMFVTILFIVHSKRFCYTFISLLVSFTSTVLWWSTNGKK